MTPTKPVFHGVAVALVTFFDNQGHVELDATAKHAHHLAQRGVRAIVIAGTTGEAGHLSTKERLQLLDAVKAAVPGHVPVLLGTGCLAAGVSAPDLTRRAAAHGASGALVLSPAHGDVREFYGEVTGAANGMPVIAYHYPAMSGTAGISIDDLKAIKVAGIKDSTGDNERLLEELVHGGKPVYVGSAAITAYAGLLGCTGAILATANLEPELCMDAFAGNVSAQKDLLGYHQIVVQKGVKGIKEELARRFGTSTVCR
jgi:4-hydroxy-tetrahydrodipicolinate synthase